jgi:hypothetical protein
MKIALAYRGRLFESPEFLVVTVHKVRFLLHESGDGLLQSAKNMQGISESMPRSENIRNATDTDSRQE